jgi:hypothetical protein
MASGLSGSTKSRRLGLEFQRLRTGGQVMSPSLSLLIALAVTPLDADPLAPGELKGGRVFKIVGQRVKTL